MDNMDNTIAAIATTSGQCAACGGEGVNTMTTFYRKTGRRYHPVSEYDNEVLDALPYGSHLITVRPGIRSTRFDVEPDAAPLVAAIALVRDELCKAVVEACKARPAREPLTKKQVAAWQAFADAMGDGLGMIQYPAAWDIVGVLERDLLKVAKP